MKYKIYYNGGMNNTIYNKVAVIVEPRQHPYLVKVVKNFIDNLPDEWYIKIFHGLNAKQFILDSELKPYIESGKILLQRLSVDNLNAYTYSDLFKTTKFWEDCLGENILIFQTDSILCSKSKFKIDDFLDFHYIGSAWSNSFGENTHGGNGGLSFRKASSMIECINKYPPVPSSNHPPFDINKFNPQSGEDVYFIQALKLLNKKIGSRTDCLKFGVQHFFSYNSFGAHKFYDYLKGDEYNRFIEYCPEGNIIIPNYLNFSQLGGGGKRASKEILNKTLEFISKLLNKNSINDWFIGYGTLLGIIRENSCIDGDDDIDIIINKIYYDTIKSLLIANDFKIEYGYGINDSKNILKTKEREGYSSIDFYMVDVDNNGNFNDKWNGVIWSNCYNDKKKLIKYNWNTIELQIPNNYKSKLINRYGDTWYIKQNTKGPTPRKKII
jgi:hypothetical protein